MIELQLSMRESEDSRLYQPRTARQHQWFIQLETACDVDDWIRRWCPEGGGRVVAQVRGADRHTSYLEITPQFQRGVRRVIFARLMDLAAEGHWREAIEIVVGWRAPPPSEQTR
jgi:hypothetical protein